MKYSQYVILAALITISILRAEAQIQSTTAGGAWNATSTWVGGVVPTASHDVVINGTVSVNLNAACRNVTVNSGAILQNDAWHRTMTVNGNVTNNGIIRNHDNTGWLLTINITGNISNNGTWTNYRTQLTGTSNQTLTQGSGRKFECEMVKTQAAGSVTATSALTFTKSFNLGTATLDAQNFTLTFEGSGHITGGRVTNARDLHGISRPVLRGITFAGNPTIRGLVQVAHGVTFEGTLTVTDTLQNDAWHQTMTVNGNVTNNGIIRNHDNTGWLLTINITGNISNNGTWTNYRTQLTGTSNQTLTQGSGRKFECEMVKTQAAGSVTATSALTFTKSFNLGTATLDAQNFTLTFEGSGHITGGRVTNARDLHGISRPVLRGITFAGNPTIRGLVQVAHGVTFEGTLTVTDTLQNDAWHQTMTVNGNVTNNGIIRNHDNTGWLLTINITGNISNNGTWTNSLTRLTGSTDQTLSSGTNKSFGSPFEVSDTLGVIKALTPLTFRSSFDLKGARFDLQEKTLTLESNGHVTGGRVANTRDIVGRSNASLRVVTFVGNPNIRELVNVAHQVTFEGTLTVTDTLQNDAWHQTMTVNGNVTNNGTIRNFRNTGWNLIVNVTGNVVNNGTWANHQTNLTGSGTRTVHARGATSTFRSTGAKVSLRGENVLPNLAVVSPSRCILENGTLRVEPGSISGTLENRGQILTRRRLTTTQDYTFYAATAHIVQGSGIDTLLVFSHGHQVPQTFANAVKSWWRVSPVPSTAKGTIASLTLSYTDAELGSHNESNIQVYHSADSGKSWTQVSTSLNTTRNATANTISITNVHAWGDYLVSAVADPISVRPSIIVNVIGRPQIRVLAPNRYTVHYVNNSDFPTDDFLIAVNVGARIRILRTEHPRADGRLEVVPFDSLSFAGEDSTFVFYAAGMGPREERTFNVVATADAVGLGKTSGVLVEPLTVTVGVFLIKSAAVYATVKAIDYIGSKAKEGLQLTSEEKRQWEQHIGTIPEEIKQKDTKKEWAMKKISTKIIEKSIGVIGGTVDVVRAVGRNLREIGPNLRRKVWGWLYKESGLYGVEEKVGDMRVKTEISGATQMKTERVTSWDPNEKVAPPGFGPQGFISTAGRMNYRILFENLKTARAPAWRVIIVDTLGNEFDPATVEFGITSHEGRDYQWKMTRTENILRWEIEGIELPPNKTPPEGEGYVSFSVMPKANLASGTALRNRAEIVFDLNKPIVTNTVVNTLDFTPPTTTMRALPETHNRDSLVVKWQSSDGPTGSGVESVALFASKDGGPFVHVGTSFTDSMVVKVSNGAYKFYGLATDNVGNVESVRPAVVQTTVSVLVRVVDDSGVPHTYELLQNYPNPFNASTTILFSIAEKRHTTLRIYDLLGRVVASLKDEELQPGRYSVEWRTNMISSGVYFYRLESGGFVETRRLMLLK